MKTTSMEFARCTTLKVQNGEGLIIGSVNGNVTDGSLYIGRLMVLPEMLTSII